MDLVSRKSLIPPITSPADSIVGLHSNAHSSDTSFPIIAIAIIGILATAFLLVSYYVFVIKCCLNWHRIDLLRRFSLSRNRTNEDPLMGYSPAVENRGLDESIIRSIPIFKFKKDSISKNQDFCECAVCLNEFQEDEKLRIIPNCSHVFHIDCIDIWLQNNANCPLCRNSISSIITTTAGNSRFPFDHIIAPSSSPQDPNPSTGSLIGGDEDYVVIELGNSNNHNSTNQTLLAAQEKLMMNSGELLVRSISTPSPRRKVEQRGGCCGSGGGSTGQKKSRKFSKLTSMGDECINIRGKEDQFAIQPIRRSFSMDSSADRQLYLAIQEIAQKQSSQLATEVSPSDQGCSSTINGRPRRNFFSFGHSRGGSRNAVLPVYLEP